MSRNTGITHGITHDITSNTILNRNTGISSYYGYYGYYGYYANIFQGENIG